MQVQVLGSGAGGGFPQWNCGCPNCAGLRAGTLRARARTQSSIALSGDGQGWLLVNASPDIRVQIESFPPLQPGGGAGGEGSLRGTGIRAVLLVDSQIDHTTGLLILREGDRPIELWCTDPVAEDLSSGFPVLRMLEHYCGVRRHPLPIDGRRFSIPGLEGLELATFALSSKAPPYSPHREDPHPGDNVGLVVTDTRTGGTLFYAPGLGGIEPAVEAAMARADCILVDGTFWTEDEMLRRGVGRKKASEMGHLALSGSGGMLEVLARHPGKRRVLIHINNTNPILDEDSPERAQVEAAGVEVAEDGMSLQV